MKKKSKSVIRLKYIELIAFMETWLAVLCFVVGIKWLIGLSIALFAIPLWGLISHRRWCRAHNEPYANWEFFYTVIAWIVYIFITLVIYFHFFTWSYTKYSVMLRDTAGEWLLPNMLRLPRFSTPPSLRDTSPIFCIAKHPAMLRGTAREVENSSGLLHSRYFNRQKRNKKERVHRNDVPSLYRAEDEAQTRDPQLGRLMLYQLSYFRNFFVGKDGFEPPKA